MSSAELHSVRMVVQQIGTSNDPPYRLVVYGEELDSDHVDFHDARQLVDTLRSAVPLFDFSKLILDPLRKGQGSIAFSGEVQLTRSQLSLLGLG